MSDGNYNYKCSLEMKWGKHAYVETKEVVTDDPLRPSERLAQLVVEAFISIQDGHELDGLKLLKKYVERRIDTDRRKVREG